MVCMTAQRMKTLSPLFVEFLGSFFLVLTIHLSLGASNNQTLNAAMAIGSVLMVMVYSGGHISGGHYNPAVTLAVLVAGREKIARDTALTYMGFQLLGGVLGGISAWLCSADLGVVPPEPTDYAAAWYAEFLFTFALCWIVLNTATSKHNHGNSFYGMAIGFIVVVGIVACGHISGGQFNPAVATGLFVTNMVTGGDYMPHWWL